MVWQRQRAYDQDFRDRVLAAADTGVPVTRITEMLFVGIADVSKAPGRRPTGKRPGHGDVMYRPN